ncbi:MAG: quinolinate synthase NadA [Oscillospiraceae bacterium]|nr:quinolinate synthase NadA [Oscillospiraceae bacterium]MDD4414457.1 quinolinate synthase NadA [Oscillospiraceae bacterium]
MLIKEMQDDILRLKKEKDVFILAHSYQAREIIEIADFTGDSYQLSVMAQKAPQKTVMMCGVRFMAETVKILSEDKQVMLANPYAGCPMAEQISVEKVEDFTKNNPGYTVVAYINTTAALKTICDVCVTSSTAVKIVKKIVNDKILFLPDSNLGAYIQSRVPEKEIQLLKGCCPVHAAVGVRDVEAARKQHPNALLLVHPECVPSVVEKADFVGSTSAIMDYAKNSDNKDFIIGTENSIAEHLQYQYPDKNFYPLFKKLICPNMKLTTLVDVWRVLNGQGGEEIRLPHDTIVKARRCIEEMIRLGG